MSSIRQLVSVLDDGQPWKAELWRRTLIDIRIRRKRFRTRFEYSERQNWFPCEAFTLKGRKCRLIMSSLW